MATMNTRIDKWFGNVHKEGKEFIRLAVDAIVQMAVSKNWDAAARIAGKLDGANMTDVNTAYRMMIRCYFGDRIVMKKDDAHPTGYRFAYKDGKWPEEEIAPGNHWAFVVGSLTDGESIFDKVWRTNLRKEVNPPKEKSDPAVANEAKHVANFLVKNGFPLSELLPLLEPAVKQAMKDASDKQKKEAERKKALREEILRELKAEEEAASDDTIIELDTVAA